jgi:hypothetical protein
MPCTASLPTDDLLAVMREFINPAVSRAGLGRCLRRHGISKLSVQVAHDAAESSQDRQAADRQWQPIQPERVYNRARIETIAT